MTYKEQLNHPIWKKKRVEILERDEFTCQQCGDKDKTLHVHHYCYENKGMAWDVPNHALVAICEDCHFIGHMKNLTALESYLINLLKMAATCGNDFNKKILYEANKFILNQNQNG